MVSETTPAVAPSSAGVRVLWLTLPIGLAALVSSLAGLLDDGVYERETTNWAAQAVGQDAVNLVVFPLMFLAAWWGLRGSARAVLLWTGLAMYSAYSYLLYAGFVHFTRLFPLYLLAFGCSVFATVAGLVIIDPRRLRRELGHHAPARDAGTVLVALGALFALLWLSEFGPHVVAGTTPEAVTAAGLPSNPVWVLDLGMVLPAMVITGVWLRRGRPLGYLFAVPLLTFGVAMSSAILGMFVALWLAGEPLEPVAVAMVALVLVAETVVAARLLHRLRGVPLTALLRPSDRPEGIGDEMLQPARVLVP